MAVDSGRSNLPPPHFHHLLGDTDCIQVDALHMSTKYMALWRTVGKVPHKLETFFMNCHKQWQDKSPMDVLSGLEQTPPETLLC